MKPPYLPSKQRGFTALELIIVLVIGFSILALAASKMGELFSSSKATQAVSNLLTLATALREYGDSDNYQPGDQIKHLLAAEMFPKPLKVDTNSKLIDEWGNLATVEFDGSKDGLTIAYLNVEKSACNRIAKHLVRSGVFRLIKGGRNNASLNENSKMTDIVNFCTPNKDKKGVPMQFIM